jgi:hypothetical protein
MTHNAIEYLIFHIIKLSGALWAVAALFGALATGQAEISYKFYGLYLVLSFMALLCARWEGHRAERHPSNIQNLTGHSTEEWETLLGINLEGKKMGDFFERIVQKLQTK